MTIITAHASGAWRDDRPLDDTSYLDAYVDLGAALKERDADLYITRTNELYLGAQRFARGWKFVDGTFTRIDTPFAVDLIFNKASDFAPEPDVRIMNSKALDHLCNDKIASLALFADFFPPSVILRSAADIPRACDTLQTDRVVVKPATGFGGKGVWIGDKNDMQTSVTMFPSIAQEFIDTSQGIPGVVSTFHDFRMIVADGELILVFLRVPRPRTSLVSNARSGGIMMTLSLAQCPPDAAALIKPIDERLQQFGHRLYSIDCGRNPDGTWKLIELNSPPGQHSRLLCGDDADFYFQKLTDLLLRAAG